MIEVNIHPAASWDELVKTTTALYEEARLSRLGTENSCSTAGTPARAAEITSSSAARSPADPPLLRNPGLLRSLIGYWHNHPALSYLFSGLFVGPTSQAPRIDEARNDQVYEMEIAFQQIPESASFPPWLVDRIFRNLLIDASGSTHRAELCIDKLYSPGSASGRLGLLEMRAFEMPPHARMSLTQHLLLRSLIAHFWKRPYRQDLVAGARKFTTALCCRISVRQDLEEMSSPT